MGITDEVEMKLYCPYCGKKLEPYKSFQTKDLNPDGSKYTIIQALMERERQGGGWLHVFFSCEKCKKSGYVEISDYDWKLTQEIREVLDKGKRELKIIENKYINKSKD